MSKQKSYFDHVKDVTTDLNMIEIAVDEAWKIEMDLHSFCQRAAIKCMRKNIKDESLFIWICNHLECERGLTFKLQKMFEKFYSHDKRKVDWISSVKTCIIEVWAIFQMYYDTYQDVIFILLLHHVSNKLLVNYY